MSQTIDDKIVSLEFDNKNFEKNVSITLNTLDKLKSNLNFPNSVKSLDNLNSAINKIDMSNLSNSIDNVANKFSALELFGVTAIVNLSNQFINFSKRMASSFTIDPIISGFREYETQLGAVQTILANTESKGSTLDDVNAALDELNTYADKTIYNFTEMTKNIGTFTAAGVALEKSTQSIKGIANLAAVSGSTSQQASVAMYQLSQALAAGRVSLMDWNSVVNAGMGGELFQNALKRTARNMGYNVDAIIEKYGSFRESLTKGEWLTTEVLTETLAQLSGAYTEADLIAQGYTEEQAKEITKLADTAINAATKVKTFTQLIDTTKEAIGSGWAQTWEIIFGDFEEAKLLWTGISDVITNFVSKMSDSRNSILEGIFGRSGEDVDDVIKKMNILGISTDEVTSKIKELARQNGITNEEFDEIIKKTGSLSNAFKRGELSTSLFTKTLNDLGVKSTNSYDILIKKINQAGISTEDFESKIRELAIASGMSNEEFDEMILKYGSIGAAFRRGGLDINIAKKALDSFGSSLDNIAAPINSSVNDLEKFQKVVNDVIKGNYGNGVDRINSLTEANLNYAAVQDLVNKVYEKNNKTWNDTTITLDELTETLNNLSDSELESLGYTEEQINSFKELSKEATESGMSIDELINSLDQRTGRELLIDGFSNIASSIGKIVKSISDAWSNIFPPVASKTIWNLLKGFYDITEVFLISDENADKLRRTFEGLFAVIDIITTVLGGGFKLVFESAITLITELYKALGLNADSILDITAYIGDSIVQFRNWVKSINPIPKLIKLIAPLIVKLVSAISSLIDTFLKIPEVQKSLENISNVFSSIFSYIEKIINNIVDSINKFTEYLENINEISLDNLFSMFKNGVSIGDDFINGLKKGLSYGIQNVYDIISNLANKILEIIKDILGIHSPSTEAYDIGINIMKGLVNGIKYGYEYLFNILNDIGKTILNSFNNFSLDPLYTNISSVFGKIYDLIKSIDLGKLLMITPIGAVLYTGKKIGDVVNVLIKGLSGFSDLLESFADVGQSFVRVLDSFKKTLDAKAFSTRADGIKTLAVSIAILVGSLIALTFVDERKLLGALAIITVLAVILGGLAFAIDKLNKTEASIGKDGLKLSGVKSSLVSISAAILLLAVTAKLMGNMNPDQLKQGFLGLIGVMAALIAFISLYGIFVKGKAAQNIDKAGKMIRSLSVTLLLMVAATKLAGMLNINDFINAGIVMAEMIAFLILTDKLIKNSKNTAKALLILNSISSSLLIMAVASKLAGMLNANDIINGAIVIGEMLLIVLALQAINKFMPVSEIAKVSATLLAISTAIGIFAITCKLLGMVKPDEIEKGLYAMGIMLGVISAMILITKVAKTTELIKAGSTILAMSVGVAAMAAVSVLLGLVDTKALIKGVTAVSILGLVMAAMAASTKGANNVKSNIIAMTVAIGVMALAVAALSTIDTTKLLASTLSLTSVMLAMTAMIAVSKKLGNAKSMIPNLLIISGVLVLLTGIIYIIAKLPIESALAATASLSILLIAISGAMLILNNVKAISMNALIGLGIISGVIALLAIVLSVISALNINLSMSNVLALSTMLISMSIALAILSAIGAVSSAAISGALSLIGVIAILGGFLIAVGALMIYLPEAETFLNKGIDIIKRISYGIGEIISSFAAGLTSGLPEMASNLSLFMENLKGFIDGANNINPESMEGVKSLAEAILTLTAADILDSLTSFITGGIDFNKFAVQLGYLGKGIYLFGKEIEGINSEEIVSASSSLKSLSDVINSMPKEGGMFQWFTGNVDLEAFSNNLPILGNGLKKYSESVIGINAEAIASSAEAGKYLTDLANAMPKEGGIFQWFTGTGVDMSTFATDLVNFGNGLSLYSQKVSTLSPENIQKSAEAGKYLTDLAKAMPNEGGFFSWFTGNKSNLSSLGNDLVPFGEGLSKFSDSVLNVNFMSIKSVVSVTKDIIAMLQNMSGIDQSWGWNFTNSMNLLYDFGINIINKIVEGIDYDYYSIPNKLLDILADTITYINNKYTDFYNSGKYLVEGFANGINDNTYLATAKATAMAGAAAEAARRELDEHSPSKVGYQIGDYFGVAFVNAIGDYARKAYNASKDMAENAKVGLTNSIKKIYDIINFDLDTINPTISPVLDLSNVEEGANKINSLFGSSYISMYDKTNKISSDINERKNKSKYVDDDNNINSKNTNYVFNQYNSSPKALTTKDIYRNTKNQFAKYKEEIEYSK